MWVHAPYSGWFRTKHVTQFGPMRHNSGAFAGTFKKENLLAGVARLVGSGAADGHLCHHMGRDLLRMRTKTEPSDTLRLVSNDMRSHAIGFLNPGLFTLCNLMTPLPFKK